ncbi:Response regulator protein [Xylella fastidiosa EB92.1]|nr:Response regulator protein [Xylella fastidiosa EB92.1]
MNTMLLEMQLSQAGASVIDSTALIEDAIALINQQPPDIAILDHQLGNGRTSGIIAKRLSELDIPFVLATGTPPEYISSEFASGVILTKPYLTKELIHALEKAYERTPSIGIVPKSH